MLRRSSVGVPTRTLHHPPYASIEADAKSHTHTNANSWREQLAHSVGSCASMNSNWRAEYLGCPKFRLLPVSRRFTERSAPNGFFAARFRRHSKIWLTARSDARLRSPDAHRCGHCEKRRGRYMHCHASCMIHLVITVQHEILSVRFS